MANSQELLFSLKEAMSITFHSNVRVWLSPGFQQAGLAEGFQFLGGLVHAALGSLDIELHGFTPATLPVFFTLTFMRQRSPSMAASSTAYSKVV